MGRMFTPFLGMLLLPYAKHTEVSRTLVGSKLARAQTGVYLFKFNICNAHMLAVKLYEYKCM